HVQRASHRPKLNNVAGAEGLCLAGTGKCDFSANHHDARVPIMGVVGVHFSGSQAAVEDFVTLAPQLGLKLCWFMARPFSPVVRPPAGGGSLRRALFEPSGRSIVFAAGHASLLGIPIRCPRTPPPRPCHGCGRVELQAPLVPASWSPSPRW